MKTLLYSFTVRYPDHENAKEVIIERKGLSEEEIHQWFAYLKEVHKDNTLLMETFERAGDLLGYGGISSGPYEVTSSAYLNSIPLPEFHECGRRKDFMAFQAPLPDHWDLIGSDKVCSYCGSLHPDSVLDILREHGPQQLQGTTKNYKWYVQRPGVRNAGQGGIKYYRHHDTEEFIAELNKLLGK